MFFWQPGACTPCVRAGARSLIEDDCAFLSPGAAAQSNQQRALPPRPPPHGLHAAAVAGVDLLGVCAPLRRHVLLRRLFHGCGVRLPSRHRSHRRRRRAPRPRGDSWRRLDQLYGSLPRTMWTLLLAITNGADWTTLAEPLADVHMVYVAIFAVYVVLVLVGALNVLTSVFVERARELSSSDRDLATQAELASQEAFIVEMRRIFEEVDGDKDGMITWEKFRDYLKNEQAQAFFTTQALDTSDAAGLFSLLDKDGRGKIKVEDFALGCMKLRGQAKSSEVATLLRESRKASRKLMTEIRQLKDQLELGQPGEVEHAGLRRGAARRAASCTPSRTGRSGTFVHAWSQYDAASPPTSRQCCS
ncbi:unnamed protein product [Prorocentrum cordatum]|uniref:EF-hand domain-containing protein n=1 Tax=Prorocentrum cordatum TaxID=2364126 RepID=A0ABN9RVE8_9DINO|nr:unnamed protein product [Polarella glacialis]